MCSRSCVAGFPCAPGETCTYSLHDGDPATALNITQLCTQDVADGPCVLWRCTGCEGLAIGETHCEGGQAVACLLGVHPTCGVSCQKAVVASDCDSGEQPPELCSLYPCHTCGAGIDQSGAMCVGSDIVSCFYAEPMTTGTCDVYCTERTLVSCPNGCEEPEPLAAVCSE